MVNVGIYIDRRWLDPMVNVGINIPDTSPMDDMGNHSLTI